MSVHTDRPIVVTGGTGFVGRHVVARLVADGHRVIVPTRRRTTAAHLLMLPTVDVVEADIHDAAALARLARGAAALVNLVGILNEQGGQTFARAHIELARSIVTACKTASVRRVLQMSGLNADPAGPSRYLRSKGEAEAIIAASGLDWTIFQPSVIFGPEDRFLNIFAAVQRLAPLMALARADARFQPIAVGMSRNASCARLRWMPRSVSAIRCAGRACTRCANSCATPESSRGALARTLAASSSRCPAPASTNCST